MKKKSNLFVLFLQMLKQFLADCFHTVFHHKKIVIISEKKITSLPFGKRLQVGFFAVSLVVLVWISFTSGKFFKHQEILRQKEQMIVNTNLTNKDLLYQIGDLHNNLSVLNYYFTHVAAYDQLTPIANKLSKENLTKAATSEKKLTHTELNKLRQGATHLLQTINENIKKRIGKLEHVISQTGMDVEKVANQTITKENILSSNKENDGSEAQGGPYIPLEDNQAFTGIKLPDNTDPTMKGQMLYLLRLEKIVHKLPLTRPINNARITSYYGKRLDPIRRSWAIHRGIDFAAPFRAEIISSAPGVVTKAGYNGAYGLLIEIDHGYGFTTRYGHLSKIFVKKGHKVDRNSVIGLQGNSGRSTGSHLHYEIRYNNITHDPYKFLKAGEHVF